MPHEVPVATNGHGWGSTEAARVFGEYTADVLANNMDDFRIFGPDETASNRLQDAYKVTKKQWDAGFYEDEANDELLAGSGKVVEQLSEHQCEGFLEAYVLTGRSGVWSSYESFVHVSIPWSTSTASGSRPPSAKFRGVPPSAASTFCCRAMSGARTTTVSLTRIPALSTCCSTRPTTRIL